MNTRTTIIFIVTVVVILLGAWKYAASTEYSLVTSNLGLGEAYYAGISANMLPDASKTPGAINTSITQQTLSQTLCNPNWKTSSVRDTQSTPTQKRTTYQLYGIIPPKNNVGQNQVCELDHLISLENGGADTLDNIWPECGPLNVPLNQRYFKMKDKLENTLHAMVCSGQMTLAQDQHILVTNWYAEYQKLNLGKQTYGGIDTINEDDEN